MIIFKQLYSLLAFILLLALGSIANGQDWETMLARHDMVWGQFSEIGLPVMETPLHGADEGERPNVLFISIDDLNDWIGCLGGHPQARTPNIDRLAASGVLFTNAHCSSPSCNPSRTAIMTGLPCYKSGLYDNRQRMRDKLPDAELIPKYFSRNGYWSAGSGKLLHYFIDADSWDEYFPAKETENPFPRTLYPDKRPVSLPRAGKWQYIETDWGPLDVTDEEFGGDWLVSGWIGDQLSKKHEKPFFLACGIYRPHEPWFVPKKYFDQFPLDEIQLPPGYKENDLDDVPAGGTARPRKYFPHIQEHGQWKKGIQGYLASIAFADAMVGRVLKSLEEGPNRDNTIVVLWSDHGWHLGEKEYWQKYTGWRVCTRVPLMVRVPEGVASLPDGTPAGAVCDSPVSLASLFTTLTDVTGLPAKEGLEEPSLLPLLKDPNADWPHFAITHMERPENFSVSGKRFRYIHYANGDEELYDIETDRYEWNNLAGNAEHVETLARLRKGSPTEFAEFVPAKMKTLIELQWQAWAEHKATPSSRPVGEKFDVFFNNKSGQPVIIYRMGERAERESYGTLESGWFKPYATRQGDAWIVTDKADQMLGYFIVGDEEAQAIIPSDNP